MNEELVFNPTQLRTSRTAFKFKRFDKGTGYVGRLNTLRPIEVLPGTTWDLNAASLFRFTTPVNPTMDNLFCDVFAYYVSDEMVLRRQSFSPSLTDGNHSFAAVMGAQDGYINMPFPDAGLQLPIIKYQRISMNPGTAAHVASARVHVNALSLLDQLGYPIVTRDSTLVTQGFATVDVFNCMPLLGYYSIWNEDFREPNLQNRFSLTITSDNAQFYSDYETMLLGLDTSGSFGASYGKSGKPLQYGSGGLIAYCVPNGVCRFHGLYGSLLPFPQRNSDPVFLPLGSMAPVLTAQSPVVTVPSGGPYPESLHWSNTNGTNWSYGNNLDLVIGGTDGMTYKQNPYATNPADGSIFPDNLYADLSKATAASINTIRVAFQTQKWFEALARGGNSDLDEYINSLFGVVGPIDVESKRPVYLGGHRFPISVSQVNNTASNVGDTGAFSLTSHDGHYVKYHSKTYGQLFFVFCMRHEDSFADAPQKFLFRRGKFDFYFPQFANLGEEYYSKNLLAFDMGLQDKVLGYQEYAADYRYDVNVISGQLRFGNDATWHYANLLEAGKFDLASWLDASFQALNVDRTLKVPGGTALMHFYYDFYIYGRKYLPMPPNSIPGLVDHH